MKKFALAILSVFMLLGGVLLSACEKQISLSVSEQEVVIYTNDEQQENYQTKIIDVTLENSDAGINVEVLKGGDCVDSDFAIRRKTNGVYAFTITATKSGSALLKVSSIEDANKNQTVSVEVKTVLKELRDKTIDDLSARSDLFVVKSLKKNIEVSDYFEFEPVTANVCDIEWQFEETCSQEFVRDDILCAKIEDGQLYVYDTYSFDQITLRAVFVKNTAVFGNVTFDVLNNSGINNFVLEGTTLYQNNVPATNAVEFALKRNDSNLSTLSGTMVINSEYDVSLVPVFYTKNNFGEKIYLTKEEIDANFGINIVEKPEINENKTKTYNFSIDAYDYADNKNFGDFYLYFEIIYDDYNYSLTTDDVEIAISTAFSATRVDLYDSEGNVLNNSSFDVFSSYESGNGFKITPVVGPDNVALDNNMFFLSVDLNQTSLHILEDADVSSFAQFYARGVELKFTRSATGSSVFVSQNLESGTDIYLASTQDFDFLENVEFYVTSVSNPLVNTGFTVNFYKISTDEKLTAVSLQEDEFFLSSASNSSLTKQFEFKIDSLSTLSGLTLKTDANNHFKFSNFALKESVLGDESYIIVTFNVTLNGTNFTDQTSFWFEHITGKVSDKFVLDAFVPMTTASIANADTSSADVFIDQSAKQGFVLKDGIIENSQENSNSLARLMLEAGTILPLSTNVSNATLTEGGIKYLYLSFEDLISAIKVSEGITEDEKALEIANSLFLEGDLQTITGYFRYFEDVKGEHFSISQDKLSLTDNEFKGIVCAIFNGYDQNHDPVTLARFFTLESFYSVIYLSSNILTTQLYTTQTLSIDDMARSRVNVTISARPDAKVPTYFARENFSFSSGPNFEDFEQVGEDAYRNSFYEISNIAVDSKTGKLTFRITANSTNLQTSVRDILTITYEDENGFKNKTEIQIEIKNMNRIEKVDWLNATVDNEIYLNLTSTSSSERSFTISTSVSPNNAYDKGLTYSYFAIEGAANDLAITTSAVGQTFNLNINTQRGGYGNLYLLPNDMIKIVNGVKKLIVYKYDENGIESFDYIELSNLNLRYDDLLNGTENFANYFLNNEGQKIYYSDIIVKIAITIADGSSEGTAIRVYNQSELEDIDTAKYYRIMNDITLSGWERYDSFSGMIFGKDENITLNFVDNSTSFVNVNRGTIKNLTFTGLVTVEGTENAGFIANKNEGTIDNCVIDVYYDGITYKPSSLSSYATSATGGLVGYNDGTVSNSFVYGANVTSYNCKSTGGLVGNNQWIVNSCGIEFYNFVTSENETYSNRIDAKSNNAGGLVGWAGEKSLLKNSYAYAYNLQNGESVLAGASKGLGAFLGGYNEGAKVEESFAYLGSLAAPVVSSTDSTYVHFVNSYITFKGENACETRIFKDVSFAYNTQDARYCGGNVKEEDHLTESDIPSEEDQNDSGKWQTLIESLDSDVWQTENIDETYNFGFMYLKNVQQSSPVDIDSVAVCEVDGKSLKAADDSGILFVYNPMVTISNGSEQSILDGYNTISVADLFGVSEKQARSLLITSLSSNISISANSIKILKANMTEFELQVHSKMDFTKYQTFKFVVVNALPKLVTTIDTTALENDQTILLQTGKSRTVLYNLSSGIYLNGSSEPYPLVRDDFTLEYSVSDNENVKVSKSNSLIVLSGIKGHESGEVTSVETSLSIDGLAEGYNNAIKAKLARNYNVSVFNGATSLVVENADNLEVRPSQFASFNVVMASDNKDDELVFGLKYDEIDLSAEVLSDSAVSFVVDSTLTLEVSWKKTEIETGRYNFAVLIKIKDSQKHLIARNYENLTLSINALSQIGSQEYLRTVSLSVRTQPIEDFSISTYSISNRFIRNSVLYMNPSNNFVTTFAPSTDAIVALTISPAYAKMSHFTLTYTSSGTSVGTVSLARLAYNPLYGYYVNSNSTTLLENGIRVNLTETDKTGDGVFYFRIYISSQFASNSGVTLTATFFDGTTTLTSGNKHIDVDYLQDAVVKVNGVSNYLLAKGSTATVTVRVDSDQTLYSLYLQNNETNILLSSAWESGNENGYKLYTASLTAKVNATLDGGKSSGVFYVCASVQRTINNVQEIKVSRATIYLVDFAIDGNGISVNSNNGTRTYNGKNYDVVYSYINETQILNFNYSISPKEYTYDKNNIEEATAVEELTQKRNQFAISNNYEDASVGYYINYRLNENVGLYQPLSLKEQLWYASDENNSTSIYNANYDQIVSNPNDLFSIQRETVNGQEMLAITGKHSGTQLMKLQTRVVYQGTEFVYDYYFLVVVEVYSDEEIPTQITTAQEFVDFATKSSAPDDYILMNDIVLYDYTPVDTDLISSLDGNGFTIHINSFAKPTGSSLNLALFNTVDSDTTLKNVRVNIYSAGQIAVNISQYTDINIAGFAITNNGVIYNCEVVSYFDSNYQKTTAPAENGLVVTYTRGQNSDPITNEIISSLGVESNIAGFAITNNASIVNSRVGGESFKHIVEIAGTNYVEEQKLGTFTILGQGNIAGFICENDNNISACYAKNMQIYNQTPSDISQTAGFALRNTSSIQNSYVEGVGDKTVSETPIIYNNLSNINAMGIVAGFIYENNGLIKNSYANIAIENSKSKSSMVAGFVYKNNAGAEVTLSYAACEIAKKDISQMQFSGVTDFGDPLNMGKISLSYFYNDSRIDDTNQSKIDTGALSVNDVTSEDTFYGFSFSSGEDDYNGIWKMTDRGIGLVSADQIALSNRYAVTVNSKVSIFYNKHIMQTGTMDYLDLSYGGKLNPIIIRNARDFALATGKQDTIELSAYKEHYSDTSVFGNYRLVDNIDMSEIGQSETSESEIKLKTTSKTLQNGLLDGNGFTISNITLGSSEAVENFGLFAKLESSVVMNLSMIVDSVHNSQANIVGTLAGTAIDTRILAISLAPSTSGDQASDTAVHGNNVVGGIVGMLFGESKLSDISISDIYIFSSQRSEKNILYNDKYTGANLRDSVENGISLKSKVKDISYAGAVAGYIDTYNNIDEDSLTFTTSLRVSDYDIVTVHVSDSVNIYGEVAGGLFGYVGRSTLVYDATLTIDADMSLTNPSYITSKNLFAGGLVGENYGGLFAVSAAYEDELQNTIEENEHNYYNGDASVERGQQSIFSMTASDEEYSTKTNDPLFVGGLVGYMGGGYIYIGYNKLNVISHSKATVAVGGIIGLAGYKDTQFDLAFLSKDAKANVLLRDVYASGDVFVDFVESEEENGISAGIIGALEKTSAGQTSVVALKNVLAMNYYSYSQDGLAGEVNTFEANEATSNKHFMLIGKIYKGTKNDEDNVVTYALTNEKLSENLYIINSDDGHWNVKDGTTSIGVASSTVGGYSEVVFGKVSVKINPFGFDYTNNNNVTDDWILKTKAIGSEDMSTMSAAYAKNITYFLENGWEDAFWQHTEEKLFPHIELLPKLNVIFWDSYNTEQVLQDIRSNTSATVVVRGKVSKDENNSDCKDIDLTDQNLSVRTIENFRGNLVSYYTYMNSDVEGVVSAGYENDNGGSVGSRVGIIVSDPLFNELSSGATIEGLNIYVAAEEDFTVAQKSELAIFRNLNIVLNKKLTLNAVQRSDSSSIKDESFRAGLITPYADSCSFINIKLTVRNDASLTFKFDGNEGNKGSNVYMGVLAGEIVQTQTYNRIAVQGIEIAKEGGSNKENVNINFTANNNKGLFVGLYAGQIIKKNSNFANATVSLSRVDGVNLNIDTSTTQSTTQSVYAGGYAGNISTVDSVSLIANDEANGTGISIVQKSDLNELIAGIGFGQIESDVNVVNSGNNEAKIVGKIVQASNDDNANDEYTVKSVKLGGLAGISTGNAKVSGFSVDFSVGKENATYTEGIIGENSDTKTENIFDQNKTKYDVHSFVIEGSDADDSVGGLIGLVNGGKVTVNGSCNVEGTIDVETKETVSVGGKETVSVGGFVGKTTTDLDIAISGRSNLNMAVSGNEAYVGGIVGNVQKTESSTSDTRSARTISISNTSYQALGTLLSNVKTLRFGGAIGYVGLTDYENDTVSISGTHFGGAVKIYGTDIGGENKDNTLDGANVSVGGVVGEFYLPSKSTNLNAENGKFTISNCVSYGDVFVNYKTVKDSNYFNFKLSEYNFGGIVGKASAIKIENCVSIMTNFNDRLTNTYSSGSTDKVLDNIGAIFGSGTVKCEGNKYSSGVCLAYQEEDGNTDLAYGSTAPYYGYTTEVGADGQNAQDYKATTDDILTIIAGKISTQGYKAGHKLNPYIWESSSKAIDADDTNVDLEAFHGISWLALSEDITIESAIAGNFVNMAFVGNGHTITSTRDSDDDVTEPDAVVYKGGVVNNLGVNKSDNTTNTSDTTNTTDTTNFSILSGFVLNLDVTVDLNGADEKEPTHAFGGVAGQVDGHSFIYGVGVHGNLSVGGTSQLNLGGIAGYMEYGYINECYVDADISYRANENGCVSGIANFGQYNTAVKATYSSGQIETYNAGNIYTFAYSNGKVDTVTGIQTSTDIIDCYSITKIKENKILSDYDATKSFYSASINSIGNVVNGCYDLYGTAEQLSVSYSSNVGLGWNSVYAPKDENDKTPDENKQGYTTWYFMPFTNYGYATHGFGWLKNVTAYTREANKQENEDGTASTDAEDKEVEDGTYTYTAISYSDVLTYQTELKGTTASTDAQWYLGILNLNKFNQMYSTVGNFKAMDSYSEPYKFFLRYDLDMSGYSAYSPLSSIGNEEFYLDGNNKTLDFSNVSKNYGLFAAGVTGTIENLRISNINATGSGALAPSVTGSINNITVTGNLTASGTLVGGVVDTLNGTAENIDSLVNITATNGGIVGGIVGLLSKNSKSTDEKNGTISNSSNAGMIVVTGSQSKGYEFIPIKHSDNTTEKEKSLDAIVGGVVGYMQSDTSVTNSYNANAVLANFTNEESYNSVAGGVAGYTLGKITNSYNTGFVGAGNYSSTSYNLAGGIFGYGRDATISGCINDGAVQAINKASEKKPAITFEDNKVGTEDNTFTNNPTNKEYNAKITYNEGENRKVYAYGLGYGNNVKFEDNNYTSTDNIKNDGDIGEITETKTLTLDRAAHIDNDGGALDFWAYFNADTKNIYANGYDSYGYPSRIYILDTMTRVYSTKEPKLDKGTISGIDNDIKSSKGTEYTGYNKMYQGEFKYSNGWNPTGTTFGDYDKSKFWGDDIFGLKSQTTYASSVEFSGYDEILKSNEIVGLVGLSFTTNNPIKPIKNGESMDVTSAIDVLDKAKESKQAVREITVNGTKVAEIYSGDNLVSILAPYSATVDVEITLNGISEDAYNSLSAKDFKVLNVKVGNDEKNVQYYEVDFNDDGKPDYNENEITLTLKYTLYFAEEINGGDITIDVTYTTEFTESLGLNNVITKDDETWILLTDESINKGIVDAINGEDGVFEDKKYSYTATIGSEQIDTKIGFVSKDGLIKIGPFENLEGYDNGIAFLIYDGEEDLDGRTLSFALTTQREVNSYFDVNIKAKGDEASYPINKGTNSQSAEFKGYMELTLENYSVNSKKTFNLEDFRKELYDKLYWEPQKLAFGNSDASIAVRFENGNWTAEGENVSINENNNLTLPEEIDETWKLYVKKEGDITYEYSESSDTLQKEFKNTFDGNEQFNLIVTSTLQDVGNFSADGKYNGSDFESEEGSGIETITEEFFGMDFVSKKVTFPYKISNIELKNKGEDVGFEIKMYDANTSLLYIEQSYMEKDATKTLPTKDDEELSIEISYNTTTKIILDDEGNKTDKVWAENHKIGSGTLELSEGGSTYNISKGIGIELASSDKNKDIEELLLGQYVSTSHSVIDETNQQIASYTYKIYANGTISVEYLFASSTVDENFEYDANSKMFIFDTANGKMYEVTGAEEEGTFAWDYDNASDQPVKYKYLDSYNGLEVDVIVADFDENNILFVRNNDVTFTVGATETGFGDEKKTQYEVPLNSSLKATTEVTDNMVDGSLVYYKEGETPEKMLEGKTIQADSFGETTYYYSYDKTVTGEEKNSVNATSTKTSNYGCVLFANDISMGTLTGSGFDNYKTIVGNGYVLRYLKDDGLALFNNNSGKISNLNLVVMASLEEANGYYDSGETTLKPSLINPNLSLSVKKYNVNNYYIIKDNDSTLCKINLYGNIRNISPMLKTVYTEDSNEKPTVNILSDSQNNINSAISINGLDGQKTINKTAFMLKYTIKNVDVKIIDNLSGESVESKNLIIAGNGGNGANGLDGFKSKIGRKGRDGTEGGSGGSVTVSDNFAGYARAGIGGLGGYGGNGFDGYFDGSKVLGGGSAGSAGRNGALGTVGTNGTILSGRNISITNSVGLGGAGGVGRIIDNIYYSASKNGTDINGSDGYSDYWRQKINGSDSYAYGSTCSLQICKEGHLRNYWSWLYITNIVTGEHQLVNNNYSRNYKWKESVQNIMKGDTNKANLFIEKIYYLELGKWNFADFGCSNWKRVIFPSGEFINGYDNYTAFTGNKI